MGSVGIYRITKGIAMDVVNFLGKKLGEWCGGWDLNPRRPTPPGPKPGPFDLARAPPRPLIFTEYKLVIKYFSPYFEGLCL